MSEQPCGEALYKAFGDERETTLTTTHSSINTAGEPGAHSRGSCSKMMHSMSDKFLAFFNGPNNKKRIQRYCIVLHLQCC